jgi:hypothetical protein
VRKYAYSLLVVLGFLIVTTTQFVASAQDRQKGIKSNPAWGAPSAAPAVIEGQGGGGSCGFTTLRFNELPQQPVNGLTFRGVRFGFTINGNSSLDARYNANGPGQGTFVQDPSLEGNAFGQLVLDFPTLTPTLSFGIARSVLAPLTPGATVALFGPGGVLIGTFPVNLAPAPGFAEGEFTYGGPTLVSRAVITFDTPAAAPRFAIDNLTYRAFDIVLQDDADSNEVLQFNSVTGDYQFFTCTPAFIVVGRGGAVGFGCNLWFGSGGGNKGGLASVNATVNTCTNQGAATIFALPGGPTFTINDSDITNNTCCAESASN